MAILTLVIVLTSLVWPFTSSFDRTGESAVDYDNSAVAGGGHDVVFGYGAQKIEDDELFAVIGLARMEASCRVRA